MEISTIITTYSRPTKLRRAVQSVADQTVLPEELIIIDDSIEPTLSEVEVEEILPQGVMVKYLHNADPQGVATARNIGVDRATKDYIAFLDDDDEWCPTKLERQKEAIKKSAAEVCCTGLRRVNDDLGVVVGEIQPEVNGDIQEDALKGCISVMQTYLINREVIQELDGFDENLRVWEDWDFCIRLTQYAQFISISEPLTICHVDGQKSLSDEVDRRFELARYLFQKHLPFDQSYSCEADREFKSALWSGLWYSAISACQPISGIRAWWQLAQVERSPLLVRLLLAIFSPLLVPAARLWRNLRAEEHETYNQEV